MLLASSVSNALYFSTLNPPNELRRSKKGLFSGHSDASVLAIVRVRLLTLYFAYCFYDYCTRLALAVKPWQLAASLRAGYFVICPG